ncbi:MAG TPA: flavodoxin-dependent (E)-4-hydroxy-3-methylbut-2-enyl-diphosphate synthase [bacterium]
MNKIKLNNNQLRRHAREVQIGSVAIGGKNPIAVQSMTKTNTSDIEATVAQIIELQNAGCDIVRVAVPDESAARDLTSIKRQIEIPLVADIHFNLHLALLAIEAGADKIRLNPGTSTKTHILTEIVDQAKARNLPIRIGVNSGSIEKDLLKKYGRPCADALVESILRHVAFFEKLSFDNLVLSLKASDVNMTIEAYQAIAAKTDYPLHLGITEAGISRMGIIKSAIGIGVLLQQGIGDTIRVSLTEDPVVEVQTALEILRVLNLRCDGLNLISCPGCGRQEVDLIKIVHDFEQGIEPIKKPVTVAIMGCEVNGPGEAREADIGIACGRRKAVLFRNGRILRTIPEEAILDELRNEIKRFCE